MRELDILVIGGGIGGLTAAIALRARGHRVTVIERDPEWSVYGVGIIQQGNVLRAMDAARPARRLPVGGRRLRLRRGPCARRHAGRQGALAAAGRGLPGQRRHRPPALQQVLGDRDVRGRAPKCGSA